MKFFKEHLNFLTFLSCRTVQEKKGNNKDFGFLVAMLISSLKFCHKESFHTLHTGYHH